MRAQLAGQVMDGNEHVPEYLFGQGALTRLVGVQQYPLHQPQEVLVRGHHPGEPGNKAFKPFPRGTVAGQHGLQRGPFFPEFAGHRIQIELVLV